MNKLEPAGLEAAIEAIDGYLGEDGHGAMSIATTAIRAYLSASPAERVPQEAVAPIEGLWIEEREDDALIVAPHWNYGKTCLARKPKLMSNEEWRPIAERIIAALAVAHPSPSPEQGDDLVQRLLEIYEHDWRISFLAHTSDTAREAATALSTLRARVAELEARATPQAGASEAEPVAQCCSAISPCSWQRHNGMDSVCPTCAAATISSVSGLTELVKWLRKTSNTIYLAAAGPIAEEISPRLAEAANEIAAMNETLARQGDEIVRWRGRALATPPDSDAVRAERERCAKIAARLLKGYDNGDDGFGVEEAIRSGRAAK